MINCPHCDAAIEPTDTFCSNCGTPLTPEKPTAPNSPDPGKQGEEPSLPQRARRKLWIALGVLCLILAVLAVIFLPRLLSEGDRTRAAMEEILSAAAPYQDPNGRVSPENRQAAIEAVYSSARSNSSVSSCKKDAYGVVITVSSGPSYVYFPIVADPPAPGPLVLSPDTATTSPDTATTSPDTATTSPDTTTTSPDTPVTPPELPQPPIPREEGEGALEIATFQPFDAESREIALSRNLSHDLDAPDLVAWETVNRDPSLWHFGAELNDDAVSMEALLSLDQYQVILWQGLGGYTSITGCVLCTGIPWSEELAQRYRLDEHNCCRLMDGTLALKPAFFAENYGDDAFYNAFIYLAASYSGVDPELAQVFLDKGAAVVFVDSEAISRQYDLDMLHLVAESFLAGPEGCKTQAALAELGISPSEDWTIDDSLELARATCGEADPDSELARVYYLCRPGMERLSYAEWVSLFDRSKGELLNLDADLTAQINREVTLFWESWYYDDYDPSTVEWMELLRYGFSKAEREGFASYNKYDYVPLEELNRCLIRAFNLRVEPEPGETYYPDPNITHWFYRLEGDQVCRPGVTGEITSKFHRLKSALRQPDGSIHLTFTRYYMETPAIREVLERNGLLAEEYAVLSDTDLENYVSRGWVTAVGTAHMIVVPHSASPAAIEDYNILRCWFEPAAEAAQPPAGTLPDLTGRWEILEKNGYTSDLIISNQRENVFDLDIECYRRSPNGLPTDMSFPSFSNLTMVDNTASVSIRDGRENEGTLSLRWDGNLLYLSISPGLSGDSYMKYSSGAYSRSQDSEPGSQELPDLTGEWVRSEQDTSSAVLTVSNQRGNVFDLEIEYKHVQGSQFGAATWYFNNLSFADNTTSSTYSGTSSFTGEPVKGTLNLSWGGEKLLLSFDVEAASSFCDLSETRGSYYRAGTEVESYYVQIVEALDDGASLRVVKLHPLTLDRDYVLSLRVGDTLVIRGTTVRVTEIQTTETSTRYKLDNYAFIILPGEGDATLATYETIIKEPGEELILPVSPNFQMYDYFYTLIVSPEVQGNPWTLQQILERYGTNLKNHEILITTVDGVITEGVISVYS